MKKFCTKCGTEIAEGKKFCTNCGEKVEETLQTQSAPVQQAQQPQQFQPQQPVAVMEKETPAQTPQPQIIQPPPVQIQATAPIPQSAPAYYQKPADERPPKGSKYAPMSTIGYIGWMILMAIPILGWIVMVILAFGGGGSVNRRNLARAILIFTVLAIVGIVVSIIMLWSVIAQLSDVVQIDFGT